MSYEDVQSKFHYVAGLGTAIDGLVQEDWWGCNISAKEVNEQLIEECDLTKLLKLRYDSDIRDKGLAYFKVKVGRRRPYACAMFDISSDGKITVTKFVVDDVDEGGAAADMWNEHALEYRGNEYDEIGGQSLYYY